MPRLAIILGSTRPGRLGEQVAGWVMDLTRERTAADFELIDLLDHPLPHLDEPLPPNTGPYQAKALDTLLDQVIAWSEALAPLRRVTQVA